MKMPDFSISMILIVCSTMSVQAEWQLSKFEYPTTDSINPDSPTANRLYGAQVIANAASKAVVSVPAPGGYIRLDAPTIASNPDTAPKGSAYSANVSMLLPLTPDGMAHDLSGITKISFEFRNEYPITGTDGLEFAFGSKSYDQRNTDSGQVYAYRFTNDLKASPAGEWKKVEFPAASMTPPGQWKVPADYPKLDSILKHVVNIRITPTTGYLSSKGIQKYFMAAPRPCYSTELCVDPDMKKQVIEVRNLVLSGVEKYPMPGDTSTVGNVCADSTFILFDDFKDGNTIPKSRGGAFWYAYADSGKANSTLTNATSTAVSGVVPGDSMTPYGFFTMEAKLKKKSPLGVWQKYAGWGSIGIDFWGQSIADLTGIKAFQFTVGDLGTNTDLVETIAFKLSIVGVPDNDIYSVELPFDKIPKAGRTFCIRPTDLKQSSQAKVIAPLDLTKVERLMWETKITDSNNKAIDTATAKIFLTNVKFYGIDQYELDEGDNCPVSQKDKCKGAVKPRPSTIHFDAHYANGRLSLSGYRNIEAFDLQTLEGRKISSFAPAAKVALDLTRGTYLLVARRGGVGTARTLVVVDR